MKYRIFEKPRFLLRGRWRAGTERILAVVAYHFKRAIRAIDTAGLSVRLVPTRLGVVFLRDPKANAPLRGVLFVRVTVCLETDSQAGFLKRYSDRAIYAGVNLANLRRRPMAPSAARPDSTSGRAAGSGTAVSLPLVAP